MFHTSTQRKHWTFSSLEELQELRKQANDEYRLRYASVLNKEEDENFPKANEEVLLCKIVAETGLR